MQISNHTSDEQVQSCWQVLLKQTARTPCLAPLLLRRYHALVARAQCIYDHLRCQPRHIRRRLQGQLGTSLAGAALALALAHSPAQAASITVDGATCTLVDAITAANSDTATGGCPAGSGADTITLQTNVSLTAVNNSTDGDSGLPSITSAITIEGAGHTIARSTAGGIPQFRLLQVGASGNLTLNGVTLTGSNLSGRGGGILNRGTVTVSNSTLSGNSATFGGGISNYGTLTVSNSTISGNSARNGGGIYIEDAATVSMSNSTVSGNSASFSSGGLYNRGTMTVSNSTISGNSSYAAGGIANFDGTLTMTNSTVSDNSSTYRGGGGGIFNGGTLTLVRTLIAGNTAPAPQEIRPASGTINVNSFNLIGHSGLTTAQAVGGLTLGASDITATSDGTTPTALAAILNPTLANNGGDTFTHALVSGSPALNAAPSGPATDQRGLPRPQGAAFDIGAVEGFWLNGSITPGTPTTSNNPTPQLCAATGTNLAIYTITAPFTNSSVNTFTDLFFRVKTLEYTTPQGGQVPSLCNATTVVNNGGVGSLLAVPNSSLPGGNSQFNPGETLTQAFQIGRPVQAQFRIKVDLFSSTATAAGTGGVSEEYLGSFEYIFDSATDEFTPVQQLFLPLVIEN